MGLSGSIFITGGAGFLGRAILRRAQAEDWDARFTVFSRDDHKHASLLREFPAVRCVRGDVAGDRDFLAAAMAGHETVIHAAANKHVDLSEHNVAETVRVNVDGSLNVIQAALRSGVQRALCISTDKVCHPVNVYGASKLLMERAFVEANRFGGPDFSAVRYGNVVGSTGSVVTVWRAMLARDGHVTATEPSMTRFWLTADQAVNLVVDALARVEPGGVLIPKLPAMRMGDMAAALLPGAEVRYAGLRPGEKRYEELLTKEETPFAKPHGDYFRLGPVTGEPLYEHLDAYASDAPAAWLSADEIRAMAGTEAA